MAISITAANFIPSTGATIIQGTAGATITQGQSVYLDTATTTYKLYDANGSAATAVFAGLACNSVASGQIMDICTRDPNLALGATVSIGACVVGSATAGGLDFMTTVIPTTGYYPCIVGIGGPTADHIVMAPILAGAVM